ncbi:phospholipase B1, membrane-associated [Elysia marginata]|uniref:Phospholipase B1, membrane-associated n=1 Tax=Elysia marginata TaxID=1093978 RepID=A0AAV4GF21_9GAST|nr:phospholipase B1, membrane-associated [Elysia marginata]
MVAELQDQLQDEQNNKNSAAHGLHRDINLAITASKESHENSTSSDSDSSDSDSSDSDSSDSDSSDSDSSNSDSSNSDHTDIDRDHAHKKLDPQDPQIDTAGNDIGDKSKANKAKQSKDEEETHFPCPRHFHTSYDIPPRSVHQLMPKDVNVVAALGDSLTAARGAGVRSFMAMMYDYRGLSWSIGGDGSYSDFTSMPNILREYNPDLYGFSNGRDEDSPGFNVAVTAATSNNLVAQTKRLILKMQKDPNVDFENDWKVITIFIGGNDVCRACLTRKLTAENFAANLKDSLDMLQDNVPRTFVNVVELMKVEMAPEIVKQNGICENALTMLCACMAIPRNEEAFERNLKIRKAFQKAAEDVVNSGDYDHKKDFTVVLQPFYKNTDPPRKESMNVTKTSETYPKFAKPQTGVDSKKSNHTMDSPIPIPDYKIDLTYFAADCFHYSRKGQASAGLNLYNNMLQPVGHKSTQWTGSQKLLCPSSQFPYFATRNNSRAMLKYWRDGEPIVTDTAYDTQTDHKSQNSMDDIKLEDATAPRHEAKKEIPDGADATEQETDTTKEPSGHAAEDQQEDKGADGPGGMSFDEPEGSLAVIVVAMIAVSIGLVGLAGFYIHRKRSKSNLYVRIL